MTDTPESVKLLPCPFCGGAATIERYGDRRQSTIYQCDHCACSLETGEEWGHGAQWNTRAVPPSPPAPAGDAVREAAKVLLADLDGADFNTDAGFAKWNRLLAEMKAADRKARAEGRIEGLAALRAALAALSQEPPMTDTPRPGDEDVMGDAEFYRLGEEQQRGRAEAAEARLEAALSEARALREEVDRLASERRNLVSHATMGGTDGVGLSLNDVSVRITELRNHLHENGTARAATARAEGIAEGLRMAEAEARSWAATWRAEHDHPRAHEAEWMADAIAAITPTGGEVGPGTTDAEVARILESPIEQIEAELREAGFEPAQAMADVRAAFDRAKAQIEEGVRSMREGGTPTGGETASVRESGNQQEPDHG